MHYQDYKLDYVVSGQRLEANIKLKVF